MDVRYPGYSYSPSDELNTSPHFDPLSSCVGSVPCVNCSTLLARFPSDELPNVVVHHAQVGEWRPQVLEWHDNVRWRLRAVTRHGDVQQ